MKNSILLITLLVFTYALPAQEKGKHYIGLDLINYALFTPNLHYEYRAPFEIGIQAEAGYMVSLPFGGIRNTSENRHFGPFARAGVNKYFPSQNEKMKFCLGAFLYWGQSQHKMKLELPHFYGIYKDSLTLSHSTWGISLPIGVNFMWDRLEIVANLVYNRVFRVREDPYGFRGYGQPGFGIVRGRTRTNRLPAKGLLWLQFGLKFRLD